MNSWTAINSRMTKQAHSLQMSTVIFRVGKENIWKSTLKGPHCLEDSFEWLCMVKLAHCFGHSLLNFDGKIWTLLDCNDREHCCTSESDLTQNISDNWMPTSQACSFVSDQDCTTCAGYERISDFSIWHIKTSNLSLVKQFSRGKYF